MQAAPPIQFFAVSFLNQELTLTLFVFRVLADDHYTAFAFDNLAFFTNRLNGRSYFHLKLPPCSDKE
jgi:hypothetical protein